MPRKDLQAISLIDLRNELAMRIIERDLEALRAPRSLLDLSGQMGACLSSVQRVQLAEAARDLAD